MYYAGQSNIAGAVGNLAGLSFPINESSRTRKIRGIRNLQEGAVGGEKEAAEQLLRRLGGPQLPQVMAPGSSNLPAAIGNMGGIQNAEFLANAQFFRGPQFGQIPPGFQGKYVS